MLWTMPLTFPLMAAVQSICGRIGRVTVTALAFNVKQSFPAWVAMTAVALLLIAHPSRRPRRMRLCVGAEDQVSESIKYTVPIKNSHNKSTRVLHHLTGE
jgi:hypothetical protein